MITEIESGCPLSFLYDKGYMKVKPIAEIIEYLAPVAAEIGVDIVDAAWDMRTRSLTVFIDQPGGLDLITCEKFHRAIDVPLDELDPTFGQAYTLNCYSRGLDRPFKKAEDFLRHLGEKVEIHLYAPYEKSKYYEGELLAFESGMITVLTEKGELSIPFEKCSKVCLLIEV